MSTPPPSTIPTVKAWTFAQLTAAMVAVAGKTLTVSYTGSGPTGADDEITVETGPRRVEPHVMVGDLGAKAWRESYDLVIEIRVARPDGFQQAEERAWALLAVAELFVRVTLWGVIQTGAAVATLGGSVYHLSPPPDTTCEADWATTGSGPVAVITYPVSIHAVI